MILKIIKAIIFAALMTLIYFISANIAYYHFNGETMFANIHYYAWVQYSIGAAPMFAGALVVELLRKFLGRE